MSSSLSVYLLDIAATRALVGSRNHQLLEVISERFGDDLACDDNYFSYEIEQGAPKAYDALREVVHGGPVNSDEDHAFQPDLARSPGRSRPGGSASLDRSDPRVPTGLHC
ncbi:DUF7691 family protein [Streptomyces chartreusis]|uniref:DUF7691 family protein n=1 Tax=Streptomyces chartreusis TaxID=1969 RepID=UPI0036472750